MGGSQQNKILLSHTEVASHLNDPLTLGALFSTDYQKAHGLLMAIFENIHQTSHTWSYHEIHRITKFIKALLTQFIEALTPLNFNFNVPVKIEDNVSKDQAVKEMIIAGYLSKQGFAVYNDSYYACVNLPDHKEEKILETPRGTDLAQVGIFTEQKSGIILRAYQAYRLHQASIHHHRELLLHCLAHLDIKHQIDEDAFDIHTLLINKEWHIAALLLRVYSGASFTRFLKESFVQVTNFVHLINEARNVLSRENAGEILGYHELLNVITEKYGTSSARYYLNHKKGEAQYTPYALGHDENYTVVATLPEALHQFQLRMYFIDPFNFSQQRPTSTNAESNHNLNTYMAWKVSMKADSSILHGMALNCFELDSAFFIPYFNQSQLEERRNLLEPLIQAQDKGILYTLLTGDFNNEYRTKAEDIHLFNKIDAWEKFATNLEGINWSPELSTERLSNTSTGSIVAAMRLLLRKEIVRPITAVFSSIDIASKERLFHALRPDLSRCLELSGIRKSGPFINQLMKLLSEINRQEALSFLKSLDKTILSDLFKEVTSYKVTLAIELNTIFFESNTPFIEMMTFKANVLQMEQEFIGPLINSHRQDLDILYGDEIAAHLSSNQHNTNDYAKQISTLHWFILLMIRPDQLAKLMKKQGYALHLLVTCFIHHRSTAFTVNIVPKLIEVCKIESPLCLPGSEATTNKTLTDIILQMSEPLLLELIRLSTASSLADFFDPLLRSLNLRPVALQNFIKDAILRGKGLQTLISKIRTLSNHPCNYLLNTPEIALLLQPYPELLENKQLISTAPLFEGTPLLEPPTIPSMNQPETHRVRPQMISTEQPPPFEQIPLKSFVDAHTQTDDEYPAESGRARERITELEAELAELKLRHSILLGKQPARKNELSIFTFEEMLEKHTKKLMLAIHHPGAADERVKALEKSLESKHKYVIAHAREIFAKQPTNLKGSSPEKIKRRNSFS